MSTTHSHRSTLSASVAVAAAAVAAANYKRYDSKNISSPGTLALSSLTFALAITATVTAARAALRL
jgi:ADP-ribosylglycohydrolase